MAPIEISSLISSLYGVDKPIQNKIDKEDTWTKHKMRCLFYGFKVPLPSVEISGMVDTWTLNTRVVRTKE